ncbi:hypothetical protein ACFLZC_01150 [Patescibacteria group bacterium]
MTPYAMECVSEEDVVVFEKIRNAIWELPDIDLGVDEKGNKIILSCHILARAVAKVFSLKYVDGYFLPNFSHSWVLSPNNHLIDVYPVAVLGGPILMVEDYGASPIKWHYKKISTRKISSGLFSKPSFRRSVRRVENILRKSLK